jgi:hypothetical protein
VYSAVVQQDEARDGRQSKLPLKMQIQLVTGGVTVFLSFLGVIAFASVAEHRGFEWHSVVTILVQTYREHFYPFYDILQHYVFSRLGITLTPNMKDGITLLALSLTAASVESSVRDGLSLFPNVVYHWIKFGNRTDEDREEYERRGTSMFLPLVRWDNLLSILITSGVYFYIITNYEKLLPVFAAPLNLLLLTYPHAFMLPLEFAAACGFIGSLNEVMKELFGLDPLSPIDRWAKTIVPFVYDYVPNLGLFFLILGLLPMAFFILAGPLLLGTSAAVLLFLILASPLLAWRTVSITVVFFSLLLATNWLVVHGRL